MFGLLNAPSPKRASSLGARPRSAPGLGKLDTFAALTVPTMCPLVCRAASGLVYPREAQSEAAKKGAKQAIPPALCLAPPVAAALLWRRLAHKLHRTQTNWRSLQWALRDRPGSRRKKERGGGWRTRLNVASIVNVNETRACLDQHQLPRRAFSGQISATSGPCPHSTGVGNTIGTH